MQRSYDLVLSTVVYTCNHLPAERSNSLVNGQRQESINEMVLVSLCEGPCCVMRCMTAMCINRLNARSRRNHSRAALWSQAELAAADYC